MRTSRRRFLKQLGFGVAGLGVAPGETLFPLTTANFQALVVAFSDTHSAYERYPQILAAINRVRLQHPRVPMLILFNGDLFERGNVVALRGRGRVDLAFVEALGQRAPVIFNLGNHEGALFDLPETVRLLRARGATVVSNAVDVRTGEPLAAPAVTRELAGRRITIAGMATDDLATYRAPVRETVRIPSGPGYAAENLDRLFGDAPLRIVLSHEGTVDDRKVLPAVPDGTLVIGGHDHLRYTHRQGRTLYLHTGSWGESIAVIGAQESPAGMEWAHTEVPVSLNAKRDAALAAMIANEQREHLTADALAVVGRTERALPLRKAAQLAVAAIRDAVGGDVGLIANTTFGAGLPAGKISRYNFDAFVRFDSTLQRAQTDGTTLQAILAQANQFDDTPFAKRTGEYVVATPVRAIDPTRRYTVVTDEWVRSNAERYLGTTLEFTPIPQLSLKTVVARRLRQEAAL